MDEAKSWVERTETGGPKNQQDLDELVNCATTIVSKLPIAASSLTSNMAAYSTIMTKYNDLKDTKTLSSAGVFGLLWLEWTPEMVTKSEIALFREIAKLGEALSTAVEKSGIDKAPVEVIVALSQVNQAHQKMNRLLPPEQERGPASGITT